MPMRNRGVPETLKVVPAGGRACRGSGQARGPSVGRQAGDPGLTVNVPRGNGPAPPAPHRPRAALPPGPLGATRAPGRGARSGPVAPGGKARPAKAGDGCRKSALPLRVRPLKGRPSAAMASKTRLRTPPQSLVYPQVPQWQPPPLPTRTRLRTRFDPPRHAF